MLNEELCQVTSLRKLYSPALTGEFPAHTLVDYELHKIQDNPENIFAYDFYVKAYPELFSTGENGMRDVSRASTTDFLKSRLLDRDHTLRLVALLSHRCK